MNDTETLINRAAALGSQHREHGIAPYGDLDDGGSACLMNELGETSETTEENWCQRIAMCEAYTEALNGPPVAVLVTGPLTGEDRYLLCEQRWDL